VSEREKERNGERKLWRGRGEREKERGLIVHTERFLDFGQAKFPDGGLVLGSSQFSILPHLPLWMMPSLKVVKIDLKISNSSI